jgi:hypothetical protein
LLLGAILLAKFTGPDWPVRGSSLDVTLLNELSPVRQLPGASTRARVEEIEKSADRHIGYECYE